MFASLDAAVTELDEIPVPVTGTAIAHLSRAIDRLTAIRTELVGKFDAAKLWDLDDAPSFVACLVAQTGCSSSEAARVARRARRLRDLPVTLGAWREGRLTSAQVDAVVANVNDRSVALFADQEAALVGTLAELDASGAKRFMRHWAERADAALNDIAPAEPEQSMHLSRTLDDRLEVRASLTGLNAAYVEAAIRLASCDDPDLSPAERRADAFGVVAKFFLDNQHGRTGGRHRPHVNVVIDGDRASLIDGTVLSTSDAAQIGCDAAFHRVLLDSPSTALDVGRATRNISAWLFTMLSLRDGGCRFPGCDRPASMTEAHHVRWWEHGGETAPGNLALLCSRHHHKVHVPGWAMKLLPDGEVHVTKPSGSELVSYPRRK